MLGEDHMKITLINHSASAEIYPELGALCASLKIKDRELLNWPSGFDPENYQKISGGLPLLFPITGRLSRQGEMGKYLYRGKLFELGIHGFLHTQKFEIESQGEDFLNLKLKNNSETLKNYPFEFEIILKFKLLKNGLEIEQIYKNLGLDPMPFYAGFHPYFYISRDRVGAELNFKAVKSFKYNEQLTEVIGEQDCLKMPIDLADPSYNERLSLLGADKADKTVKLKFKDGAVLTQISDFDYFQLYTDFQKEFICLEPWMSHPNSFNSLLAVKVLSSGESIESHYRVFLD